MKFSLIFCTLNRVTECELCMDSFIKQSFDDFEIIVIDQSDNSLTNSLLKSEKYCHLDIKYFHVNFKGISRARNYGLQFARGEYFCLIDDDAQYFPDYLERASEFLESHPQAILSGYVWNPVENNTLADYRKKRDGKKLSIREISVMCPSPALIFPLALISQKNCIFDEDFGVGSIYGAGEETDFIFQARKKGYDIHYIKSMKINHPVIRHTYEIENFNEAFKMKNYHKGFGALHKKWLLQNGGWRIWLIVSELLFKNMVKATGILGQRKKEYAIESLNGYKEGWNAYVMGKRK